MLQWLRLAVFLLVCVAVHGWEIECDQVGFNDHCWNSETHQSDLCLICEIRKKRISESDKVIFITNNHSAGVMAVRLFGGAITKMPNLIQKTNNKEISEVQLFGTKTKVLNSQFFGNAGENLIFFGSSGNDKLKVEAFAFKNCKNLQHLDLSDNKESSNIASEAFLGLQKLIELNLNSKDLSLVLTDWFDDLSNLEVLRLGYNQLAEIPENAFKALPKLKKLYMSENNIALITKNMFQHNEKLQEIDLSRNRINQIQSTSFNHLRQLTYLGLGENQCVNRPFYHKTSDEIDERLTPCYPKTSCLIPQIQNGIIVSIDDDSTQVPGISFEGSGLVQVVCYFSFSQIHDKANETTNKCVEGNWEDQQWPTCQSESIFL